MDRPDDIPTNKKLNELYELIDAVSVTYTKSEFSKPRVLLELAKGMVTGEQAELGRIEELGATELERTASV